MDLSAFVCGAGGVAIITGGFEIAKWALARRAKKADDAQKVNFEFCQARGTELAAVKDRVDALASAQIVSLHDRIKHLAKAHITRDFVTVEDLEDLELMHEAYKKLGGNGFLDDLMRTVRALEHRAK